MTKPSAALVFLLTLVSPVLAQAQTVSKDDDAALREVVRKYVDAREARDAKAVEALLTADADQLVSDGTWRHGRDSLVQGMLESSRKNPAKRTIDVETIRLVTPDVALVDGRYTQVGAADVRAMWTAFTMKRTTEGWKIAAIRNMLPAPPAK
ncbi:YybH family protein [Paludisphaera rhizosphaerae]|uniref:YybH family protein n=1 Tax=Paludisphaera rhizosphaerae TaxID=2711216 RepID=UPI0013ECAFFF|nr:SgcJ/EcaC family oxidoreductase [Paludisphaera rhizosphaerae]